MKQILNIRLVNLACFHAGRNTRLNGIDHQSRVFDQAPKSRKAVAECYTDFFYQNFRTLFIYILTFLVFSEEVFTNHPCARQRNYSDVQ